MVKRIKCLVIGDNHLDSANVKSRKDNYMLAGLRKLHECLSIARDRGCDYALFLGDFFNRIEVGGDCLVAALELVKTDPDTGMPWPFRRFIVVGNHDVDHHPAYLFERSHLGAVITGEGLEFHDFVPEYGLALAHHAPHIENEIAAGKLTAGNALIWAAHASIVTNTIFGSHVFFEDVPLNPECRLLLAGHVHNPMERIRDDGVRFINPGNIGRNSATKENMNRILQVLFIEYDLGGGPLETEYIPLKSAQPASMVFKVEEIQTKKDVEKEQEKYVQRVTQMATWTHSGDKYENLRTAGVVKNVPASVVERACAAVLDANNKKNSV